MAKLLCVNCRRYFSLYLNLYLQFYYVPDNQRVTKSSVTDHPPGYETEAGPHTPISTLIPLHTYSSAIPRRCHYTFNAI